MGIIGDRPETGLRIDIERPRDGGPPWVYEGTATTPDAEARIRVTVGANGDVAVEAERDDVAERARLIVRAAYKHADGAPPRRIRRWRAGD